MKDLRDLEEEPFLSTTHLEPREFMVGSWAQGFQLYTCLSGLTNLMTPGSSAPKLTHVIDPAC